MFFSARNEYNRNYWAMVLEGACFMSGIAYIAAGGPVSLFINAMTGSKTLIGLAVTFSTLFMLVGHLYGAPFVRTIRGIPEFLFKTMAFQRLIPLLIALPLFINVAGNISVVIFLVLFSLFWLIDGIIAMPWAELCTRALEPEHRGHMMGMQVTVGSVASLLTGILLTWLLATPVFSDHHRFGVIFACASVVLFMSIFFIRLVRDPKPSLNPESLQIRSYYAKIPAVLRGSKPLRRAILARAVAYIGFSAVSFIVVFGSGTLNLPKSQTSWLVYANIVGGLLGGVALAEASRRLGNKAVIILCNIGVFVSLAMAVSLIFAPGLGYAWLFATCVLASMSMNNWVGYFNYILDIAPGESRSVFMVINTCVGIPFSFAGYAMGAVVDNFGYLAMFAVGGFFVALTIILSTRLLPKSKINASTSPGV